MGLVDHESAGTWDVNIIGDGGCSKGIAQWNECVGRIAPKTFKEQANLVCDEIKWKFDRKPTNQAITDHNCPACYIKWSYVNKVIKASKQFK